jgi:hypothetical protein
MLHIHFSVYPDNLTAYDYDLAVLCTVALLLAVNQWQMVTWNACHLCNNDTDNASRVGRCRYFFNIKETGCTNVDLWRAFVEFRNVMRYRTNAKSMSVDTTWTVGYNIAAVSRGCHACWI